MHLLNSFLLFLKITEIGTFKRLMAHLISLRVFFSQNFDVDFRPLLEVEKVRKEIFLPSIYIYICRIDENSSHGYTINYNVHSLLQKYTYICYDRFG